MYHLAKLAKESGVKVVIGGEGADEIFLGSHVFRETAVRRFCLRRPESVSRHLLFDRVDAGSTRAVTDGERRFLLDVARISDPLFSHLPRFTSSRIEDLYTRDFRASLGGIDVVGELRASLPTRFFGWSALNQAAYLEMTTSLSAYTLSVRGDRMTMAHGVEGRYPFLDHRLFEFASALPTGSRLRGLRGKEVLRRWASRILPSLVMNARKKKIPAPAQSLFLPTSPGWIGDHLTSEALDRVGIFSPAIIGGLVRRCRSGRCIAIGENRAIVGVLSTQLWHHQFVESALSIAPLPVRGASVYLTDGVPAFSLKPSDLPSHADIGN
jgi:asparagine synthase (glutamine-hydrolysing)